MGIRKLTNRDKSEIRNKREGRLVECDAIWFGK
jgi:hypothetical protein